jgi:chemotaxis protein MotB
MALGLLATVVACGVPEEKYKAAVSEASRAMKSADDERARAEAAEKKAGELSARLAEQEKAIAAAAAEAARQRELAAQLAQERTTLQQRSAEYQSLASSLDQEIKAGRVQLSELQGKLTVRMAEKVLFASGSAVIGAEGKKALAQVAEAFKTVSGRIIRVEGHTDNVPIRTERFPSNWELSSARAIAVVRYLQEQGVDPGLLGAAGYAEFQPMAPNDSVEGRAQNRRIEITLAAPPTALPEAAPKAP